MLSENYKQTIRNLDFYKKVDPSEWAEHQTINQVKVLGDYPDIMPKCSVVIRTYKRPKLLKRAINSVLNQEGYDDYVIIIADNEGEDLSIKTETHRVVESINSDKILYYRYDRQTGGNCSRFNAAANLVKTGYMVFLNDDDVFHKSFLRIMMDVMEKHDEIDALMCSQVFLFEDKNDTIPDLQHGKDGLCRKVAFLETLMSRRNNTTGVLYKTAMYRDVGGALEESLGCGDVIMASRFSYYYDQYWLDLTLHGVYVNSGTSQLSMGNADGYYQSYFVSYFWRKNGLMRCFWRNHFFIEGILQRALHGNISGLKESMWKCEVSEKEVFEALEIKTWNEKNIITRTIYNWCFKVWNRYIDVLVKKSEKEGFFVEI